MSLLYPKQKGYKETVISWYFSGTKGNNLKSPTGIENRLSTLSIWTNTPLKAKIYANLWKILKMHPLIIAFD